MLSKHCAAGQYRVTALYGVLNKHYYLRVR